MPKEIAVIYRSKYGSTKQYAEWLAESLNADLYSEDAMSREKLTEYKTVVVGGWIRIGKIMCAPFVIKNWDVLKSKKVIVFSVSATKPTDPEIQKFFEKNFPSDIRAHIAFFPLWGRFTSLDLIDQFLILVPRTALYIKLLASPSGKGRGRLQGISKQFDHVERSTLEPIIAKVSG